MNKNNQQVTKKLKQRQSEYKQQNIQSVHELTGFKKIVPHACYSKMYTSGAPCLPF